MVIVSVVFSNRFSSPRDKGGGFRVFPEHFRFQFLLVEN